jgi:hypothetical protein
MANPEQPSTPPLPGATPSISPRDKRVVKHVRAIADAGSDIEKFVRALREFRDDLSLTTAQRDAIFKTLAQDASHAYFVMVTGKPIDWDQVIPREKS